MSGCADVEVENIIKASNPEISLALALLTLPPTIATYYLFARV